MNNFITIDTEKKGIQGIVWLNRPEVHNAFNTTMISEIQTALDNFGNDNHVSVVVFRGRGKSFSSGADLNHMKEMSAAATNENYRDAISLARFFYSVYTFKKPVISVVHGNVNGGANGIVAASDVVIAEENAVFRLSELRLGLVPATIAPYLLKKTGTVSLKELMFTGRAFSAKEAKELFLVNHIAKMNQLEDLLDEILNDISKAGPLALQKTKQLLNQIMDSPISEEMIQMTSEIIADARTSEEGREGITAFLEKRHPEWLRNNKSKK